MKNKIKVDLKKVEEVPQITEEKSIAHFLNEMGTLRKIARAHRQTLLEDDLSDNIASHSFRVTVISWFLAKLEKADPYKTVMMALMHDSAEARTNDHNWIHKKYTKVFEEEIIEDQIKKLPFGSELGEIVTEYRKRESVEAKIAKDADLLDQILLLKEYSRKGNKEADRWLMGLKEENRYYTKSVRKLVKEIYEQTPSDWWKKLWTSVNR